MNDPVSEMIRRADAVARDAAAPAPTRRRLSRAWIAVAATLLIITGLAFYVVKLSGPKPAGPADTARPVPVTVAAAIMGDFGVMLEALGTVTPIATVLIKTQISGRIVEIGFTEGQMVKEGDFLGQIDPRPYQHALHQAQGQLQRDQALLKNAKLDLERYRLLVEQNSAPRQQFDTQESLVEQYKGVVEIDQANPGNTTTGGAYGFHVKGTVHAGPNSWQCTGDPAPHALAARTVNIDSYFVCGNGALTPGHAFNCVEAIQPFPGRAEDGYEPNNAFGQGRGW